MALTADVLVAVIAALGLIRWVPLYMKANGHRPFIFGYMTMFSLMCVGAIVGLLRDSEDQFYPYIRLTYEAVLWATTIWALRAWRR